MSNYDPTDDDAQLTVPGLTPLKTPITLDITVGATSGSGKPPYEYSLVLDPVTRRKLNKILGDGYQLQAKLEIVAVRY